MSFCSLVHWEDPIKSGVVFGTVLVSLMSICYYSLISVLAYCSLTLLAFVLGVKLYSYVMVMLKKAEPGSNPLAKVSELDLTIPNDKITEMSNCLGSNVNRVVSELRRLFLVENMVDTIKFGLSCWALTYIGSWFNALTLLILAWVGAFTLPKVYQNNQAAIDDVLGKVKVQIDEVKGKVVALIPSQAKPAEKTE